MESIRGKVETMRQKRGVTLIELLIVVLILASLAAVAVPRISKSSASAKENACATNVDLINSAIEMYYIDEGSYPTSLNLVTRNDDYFPDGAPECPLGGTYTMGANHRVTCDH